MLRERLSSSETSANFYQLHGVRELIIMHGHSRLSLKNSSRFFRKYDLFNPYTKTKKNSVALVRKRTIPTELPPHVGEVTSNFCGYVSRGQRNGSPLPLISIF
jgi:hypothetical protein